jgi:ectoine hydroxylase-related dioxygenase (phytanoyl-CoA dioxygenase family)
VTDIPVNSAFSMSYAEQIDRDGYATVSGVVGPEVVTSVGRAIDAIPLGEEVRRKQRVYGVRNLLGVCERVRELAASEAVRSLVTPVLGDHAFAVRGIFFNKTPDANWKLGWHQDSVIAVKDRAVVQGFDAWSQKAGVHQVMPPVEILAGMLAVRIHLDACASDNAPLRVLPGSHAYGWLDDVIEEWKESVEPVVCVADPGDAVVMRPLILHASAASQSPGDRRVVHIEFAAAELPGELEWNQRIGPSGVERSIGETA